MDNGEEPANTRNAEMRPLHRAPASHGENEMTSPIVTLQTMNQVTDAMNRQIREGNMPSDIVNEFFRKHYPTDWNTAWEGRSIGSSFAREYNGDREANSTIFPPMICADGFEMSVQGHYGAYSYPRDDFAESYSQVEIMCQREEIFETLGRGYDVADERVYPFVPIATVLQVIEAHGGLHTSAGSSK